LPIRSAKQAGLAVCPKCHKLNAMVLKRQRCVRCCSTFHQRKPYSMQFTLAWTLAAMIAFIPANMYPIMVFYNFGARETSTILSGVGELAQGGMYPIALVVFIASFVVPLSKIIGLLILMASVVLKSKFQLPQHTRLYRMVEFLGPWSMLDVFVVALMAGIVNLGFISSIEAGSGINYFIFMVVATMFAAESFDPRLLWDSKNNYNENT